MPQLVTAEQVNQFYEQHPKATLAEAAAHFDVSRSTINSRLSRGEGHRPLKLSANDQKVHDFVIDYIVENMWPPSVTDISSGVGCARSQAHNSLHRLAAAGLIEMGDGARTIRVVGSKITMKGAKRA